MDLHLDYDRQLDRGSRSGTGTFDLAAPRYLLYSHAPEGEDPGRWRFVLREPNGSLRLEAYDSEPDVRGERLELLTVVRGLEALEQPSRVTLITSSTYVREGIRHGLSEWRNNGWRWERFGQMVPVKHLDLWQRVERAMSFHQIDCRSFRIDPPHRPLSSHDDFPEEGVELPALFAGRRLQYPAPRFARDWRGRAAAGWRQVRRRLAQWWTVFSPRRWTR
jgi:ribonuclease HI